MSVGIVPPPNPYYSPGTQLLGIYSANGGASIDIVSRNQGGYAGPIFQSDFDAYHFEFINCIPSVNADNLWLRVSTNGGTTYDTGANYGYGVMASRAAGSGVGSGGSSGLTKISLSYDNAVGQSNAAGNSYSGFIDFYNPLSSSLNKYLAGLAVATLSDGNPISQTIFGEYISFTPVNACRLVYSTGTITGVILVYGKAKTSTIPSLITPLPNKIIQVVNFQTGAVGTTTTTIPLDDTIPQNTEGAEFMTCTITPTNVSNKLKIEVVTLSSHTTACWLTVALFQDSIVNALATMTQLNSNVATGGGNTVLNYIMTAGTVSPITFRVRIGGNNAGTLTFNGQAGTRLYGGTANSSIVITEIGF